MQALPAALLPEISIGEEGHAPFCCSPLAETFAGPPPSAPPLLVDEPLHAMTTAVKSEKAPKRR